MLTRNRLAVALLFVVASACGSSEPKLSVAGSWRGVIGNQTLALHLAQAGSAVTGDATISNTGIGVAALTVTGTFTAPTLTATLSSSVLQPSSLEATMSDANTMRGTLNGSGFTGDAILLVREQQ